MTRPGSSCRRTVPPRHYLSSRRMLTRAVLLLGNPFNQLATISTYLRDRFASTYYFLRALAVKESFVTARGNLQATLKGPLEAHQTARSDDPSALTKHALQSKVVILLAMLLLRTG